MRLVIPRDLLAPAPAPPQPPRGPPLVTLAMRDQQQSRIRTLTISTHRPRRSMPVLGRPSSFAAPPLRSTSSGSPPLQAQWDGLTTAPRRARPHPWLTPPLHLLPPLVCLPRTIPSWLSATRFPLLLSVRMVDCPLFLLWRVRLALHVQIPRRHPLDLSQ